MDITLELIGELLRQIQADQRDMRTRIELLERQQERAASHNDMRDLARVLTDFRCGRTVKVCGARRSAT
jgi:hypothetical protein